MINNKSVFTIVIAREGSKGIPNKNVRQLLGKPLVEWSILAALKSKYTDYVFVSSDCLKVKNSYYNILKSFYTTSSKEIKDNLYWIQRPREYATDKTTNEETLLHAMEHIQKEMNLKSDIIVHLQPTSPCRYGDLIDKCLEKYIKNGGKG